MEVIYYSIRLMCIVSVSTRWNKSKMKPTIAPKHTKHHHSKIKKAVKSMTTNKTNRRTTSDALSKVLNLIDKVRCAMES